MSTEQDEMIEKIGNLLFEAVIERSVDELDEAKMNEFEEVVGKAEGNYEEVIKFLKTRVPDFSAIVSEEMARLKKATAAIFA